PASQAAIGFALLPGAPEAYNFATKKWDQRSVDQAQHVPLLAISGRLGAVTSSSPDTQRSAALLVWLSGREAGGQVCPTSSATTLFRTSQAASPGRWTPGLGA